MLHWMGMGDMVCENLDEYVERAIHLATHPEELAASARAHAGQSRQPRRCSRSAASRATSKNSMRRCGDAIAEARNAGRSPSKRCRPKIWGRCEPRPGDADGLVRLHLAGSEPREGWKIVAREAGEGVDIVDDPRKLETIADASVDSIYAGWFYQRLSLRDELPAGAGRSRARAEAGRHASHRRARFRACCATC